jgi:hypothetical protein
MKKTGRPLKDSKRQFRYTVKVTQEEKQIIERKAALTNLKTAVFLRETALKKEIKAALSQEEIQIKNDIRGIGININQLAKRANEREDMANLVDMLLKMRGQIDQLYNRLYK